MIKKLGFTLTEVLVTLGIIGIVSAITIPTMVNNYQKTANATQLRKVLNEISTAADMLITEEGKQHLDQTSLFTDNQQNFFQNKFKIIRTCSGGTRGGCFYSGNYKSINGNYSSFTCGNQHYLLANSAAICPTLIRSNNHGSVMVMEIDINGPDAPNTGGRDMFYVALDDSAQIVAATNRNGDCTNSIFGQGCLQRLLNNNWKMNY